MKTKLKLLTVTALLFFTLHTFAQVPDFKSVGGFVLYTTTGAVGNTGLSLITGNIGTNAGAITGFDLPAVVTGDIFTANAVTLQCSIDLQAAYDQLYNTAPTSTTHAPAFGTGETLLPGVYAIGAAGSVAGDLTLNAQGNMNAVFIFKFGGAFTTGAVTSIHLINGALACNVFWAAEGAISMGAGTNMKGTLIANNGAISMAAGGTLEGRMFSTTGAVAVDAVLAALPIGCSLVILPVELTSFTGNCNNGQVLLKWGTAAESGSTSFGVERREEGMNWQLLDNIAAGGNPSSAQAYGFTDKQPAKALSYYRLKQTYVSGGYRYGNTIVVKNCDAGSQHLTAYPNPSPGMFALQYTGDRKLVRSTEIFNVHGQKVFGVTGIPLKVDLAGNAGGVYIIYVHLDTETLKLRMILVK